MKTASQTPNLDRILAARCIIATPEILALVAEEFINRFTEARKKLESPAFAVVPELLEAVKALLADNERAYPADLGNVAAAMARTVIAKMN